MPRDAAEDFVKIRGNQRQVDHAQELLQESLFVNFTFIKLRLSKHFKHDVLIGKNGVHVRSIKGERDVDIQFEDEADSSLLCVVSGTPDDCVAVCEEILIRMSRYEVIQLPVDPRSAGLIIGKGGVNIKSLKEGLQIKEDTKSNPWVISGPKEDVTQFLARLRIRFGLSAAFAGSDTYRFMCPGCALDFPNRDLMLAHVRNAPPGCFARACIASSCGAIHADGANCKIHESLCKKVQRCPGCAKAFASDSELARHVKSEGCHARACIGCQQIYTDQGALLDHQSTCEKYLERRRDLQVRTQIQELKNALCDQCRHGEQKGSSCQICKAMLRRAQLKWHPDKNPNEEIVATIIFRSVQAVWDGKPQWLADSLERDEGHQNERTRQATSVVPADCSVQ